MGVTGSSAPKSSAFFLKRHRVSEPSAYGLTVDPFVTGGNMRTIPLILALVLLFTVPTAGSARGRGNTHCEKLEKEYAALLERKQALDNNKSFQKRRKKRKYKHRPHIKKLVEEEKRIVEMLEMTRKRLDACGSKN